MCGQRPSRPDGATEDPNVFAVEDVARQRTASHPDGLRVESWHGANDQAHRVTRRLLEQGGGQLPRGGHAGRTVTVKVKYADFRQITRSRSGVHPVASREDLERTSLDLLQLCFPPPCDIRLLGVTISNFSADDARGRPQLALVLGAAACDAGPISEHVV